MIFFQHFLQIWSGSYIIPLHNQQQPLDARDAYENDVWTLSDYYVGILYFSIEIILERKARCIPIPYPLPPPLHHKDFLQSAFETKLKACPCSST